MPPIDRVPMLPQGTIPQRADPRYHNSERWHSVWTGNIGIARPPKRRDQIGRAEWMVQMFGDDWETNGRVARCRTLGVV